MTETTRTGPSVTSEPLAAPETLAAPEPLGTPALRAAPDPRLSTWRLMLAGFGRLSRRLDEELRTEHDLSLPEYEALVRIAESPRGRLRMSQLASEVELSKSGVTRLIDRLVGDGFVERCQCSHDARGAEAVLTPAGKQRLRDAMDTYLRGLDRFLVDPIDPSDRVALERAMSAISRRAGDGPIAGCAERGC
jgi:DNA-binding MarR family transcriptional regulator